MSCRSPVKQQAIGRRQCLFVRMDHANVPAKFEVRSFTRSWDNSRYLKTLGSPCIRRSRSSKVVDFGTNRKHVYDFLLVRNSNLGPISHRFGDTAGFLSSWVTPPLFHPNFWGVPVASDGPCWGQPEQRPYAIRPWNYFRRIPTGVKKTYLNVTDRRTDGQYTIAIPRFALCTKMHRAVNKNCWRSISWTILIWLPVHL